MTKSATVSSIMSRSPVYVTSDTCISRIHDIFENFPFHHLPVIHMGKVEGIISKADYLKIRHMISHSWSGETGVQEAFKNICAEDIMTKHPLCIESEDTIGLTADIFLANAFHALPVVDDGELVGIVTSHDLLQHAYE